MVFQLYIVDASSGSVTSYWCLFLCALLAPYTLHTICYAWVLSVLRFVNEQQLRGLGNEVSWTYPSMKDVCQYKSQSLQTRFLQLENKARPRKLGVLALNGNNSCDQACGFRHVSLFCGGAHKWPTCANPIQRNLNSLATVSKKNHLLHKKVSKLAYRIFIKQLTYIIITLCAYLHTHVRTYIPMYMNEHVLHLRSI